MQRRTCDGRYVWEPALPRRLDTGHPFVEDGEPIDARFEVEERDGHATVVVMSRGAGRNDDSEGAARMRTRLHRGSTPLAPPTGLRPASSKYFEYSSSARRRDRRTRDRWIRARILAAPSTPAA